MSKPLLALLLALLCLPGCRIKALDSSITSGVSLALAQYRAGSIENLTYAFDLTIPESMDELVQGKVDIRFDLLDDSRPVVIDFNVPPESHLLSINANGSIMPLVWQQGHIVIEDLEAGPQHIVITFNAGDSSLNRNPEFLYTLFVPDRASFALPLFDQPDLKGRFSLTLRTPIEWEAIGNGPLVGKEVTDDQAIFVFGETRPISTYLFSFAAGQFHVEKAERGGRTMRMLHRETDAYKVAQNRDAIFDLHHTALTWLEDYTGIPYPFQKFDFALIPPFQYGGMEHPGAIQYRASSLMLEASATQNQYLGRASLIAHETAHMWFGDLVTMQWFDDVWMKEVFANFMAAKIVYPSFPEVNHDLRFLLAHFPSAYGVDRTAGANPIRQPLENLQMAGTLYGAIIYQKAPIVMKHLERVVGEAAFQSGLQQYLAEYAYRNATWHDLIAILDDLTDEDLRSWSQVWVSEPGRPQIETEMTVDDEGRIAGITLRQSDPAEDGRLWTQQLDVVLGYEDQLEVRPVYMNADEVAVPEVAGLAKPLFVLPNGDGLGYGLFISDAATYAHLLQHIDQLTDPVMRGAAWITLWEGLLEGLVAPDAFIDSAMQQLPHEKDELNIQRTLGYLTDAYWRFQTPAVRSETAPALEHLFLTQMNAAETASMKASYFNAFRGVVTSDAGIAYLRQVWEQSTAIDGLPFSIRDYSRMAQALAVRGVENAEDILDAQEERITNPDQRARFVFVRQALSQSAEERDAFFETLAHEENRQQEPWVLDAISLLHHPLRAATSEAYIAPSLGLLEEIQRTGDIFFPKRWLDVTLSGYQSESAAQTVQQFLDENPDLAPRLRGKVLQSADMLFRAARITG